MALGDELDLGAFRFEAVIDWIEVRVTLAGLSQPQHVRSRMPVSWGRPAPYVHAETSDTSRTATTFRFRVQDPPRPAQFMRDLQALVRPGDPPLSHADIEILAVEIALDGYHQSSDEPAMVALAERFLWAQSTWAGFPHISTPNGLGLIATRTRVHHALHDGVTLNLGAKDAEFAQRVYVKAHDTQDGESYRPLPVDQHRARFETTLRGSRLPFTTIGQWSNFRFETLQREFFNWRQWRAAPPPSTPMMTLFPHLGRMASRQDRARAGRRRATRSGTSPDTVLNRLALNALRRLSRDQMRPLKKQAAVREFHRVAGTSNGVRQREDADRQDQGLNTLYDLLVQFHEQGQDCDQQQPRMAASMRTPARALHHGEEAQGQNIDQQNTERAGQGQAATMQGPSPLPRPVSAHTGHHQQTFSVQPPADGHRPMSTG